MKTRHSNSDLAYGFLQTYAEGGFEARQPVSASDITDESEIKGGHAAMREKKGSRSNSPALGHRIILSDDQWARSLSALYVQLWTPGGEFAKLDRSMNRRDFS